MGWVPQDVKQREPPVTRPRKREMCLTKLKELFMASNVECNMRVEG